MTPEVVIRQVERLAHDLREQSPIVQAKCRQIASDKEWRSVKHVYLVGCGDSFHAALSAQMAFETIGGVSCTAVTAQRFVDYSSVWMDADRRDKRLVIAISASGSTPRVVEAIAYAKRRGALTIALTGVAGSDLSLSSERTLPIELFGKERSPGIRTHQASFLGLVHLAIQLAESSSRAGTKAAANLRTEVYTIADAIELTNRAIEGMCQGLADQISDCGWCVFLGGGPLFGTAAFSAAKLIESAGIPCAGQDLEEWWHVERFARPSNMPVFILAAPGKSRNRAVLLARKATQLGRRVVAVSDINDAEVAREVWSVLPVHGDTREEFAPLLYGLFASYTAAYAAKRLGRIPFETDTF